MDNSAFISKEYVNSKPLVVQSCTDVGRVREHNDDYCGHFIPSDKYTKNKLGSLFAIADGVGSCPAGNVASAEAVNVLLQEYYFGAYTDKVPDRFKNAFQHATMHIYDLAHSKNTALQNMKCTLSSILIKNDKFYITHIGDSKIFLLRSNKLIQLTKDHSLVGKLVRLGFVSKEAAREHPNKHILLKAVGDQPILPPDFYSGKVNTGDIFCLITDGILEHATEIELQEYIKQDFSAVGLKNLITELNNRGGQDNMTIMTVKVNKLS